MNLAIYGAGGLGREFYDTALSQITAFDNVFFVIDGTESYEFYGTTVYTFDDFLRQFQPDDCKCIIAVGEPAIRELLFKKVTDAGFQLKTLCHPTATISKTSNIGNGVYIGPYAFVSSNAEISDNVIIQPHALVGHDVKIGASTVISPNCAVAGSCEIGERTYIGLNACVEQSRTIGSDTIIGMASCVNRDIPSEVIALGYPARVMKKNERQRVFS